MEESINAAAQTAERTIGDIIGIIASNPITHSVIIIIAAIIADKMLNRRLLYYISRKVQNKSEENASRYNTLFSVFSKIITAVIAFLSAVWVMQILFNVNPSSLIAATGIAGAALGLGAQSLVKDSINGFFILIEDQFGVGDYVTIEGFEGRVYSVSLRMCCIEGFDGDLMYIPNGSISKVINHSRENRSVFLDIPVSYDADIDGVLKEFSEIAAELKERIGYLSAEPEILGVSALEASAVNIKLKLSCAPSMQYQCKRDALAAVRAAMAQRGMEIPYSHVTVITK